MSPPSSSSKSSTAFAAESSIRTHSTTSTDFYSHEPFETFKLKAQTLCRSIGFGEAVVIEPMHGGSFNRVSKLTLATGDQYVLRIPRRNNAETAQNVKDQVAINGYVATHFPVPGIIAYDSIAHNAIDSPYIIQKLAPGQCLEEVLDRDLRTEDRFQIASIIADIFVRMEKISFPTPGRLVTVPGIPDRCDDFSTLSTIMAIAPFKINEGEVLKSTSSPSVADFMGAILDMRYENSQIYDLPLLSKWTRLREINQEMKSRGLLTCQQPVLWHWDFAPRNILVDRTPDNSWEVTAVLDWDGALCVPRILTRKPPTWLWQLGEQLDKGKYVDNLPIPRKLTLQEEIIKQHFEDCLEASIDIEIYRADAYDKGHWARRLFDYAHYAFFDSQDWERYEVFVKEWEAYCIDHVITKKQHNDPATAEVGKGEKSRGCTSWLGSVFKKVFMRRRTDA